MSETTRGGMDGDHSLSEYFITFDASDTPYLEKLNGNLKNLQDLDRMANEGCIAAGWAAKILRSMPRIIDAGRMDPDVAGNIVWYAQGSNDRDSTASRTQRSR